ncbi:glycosyltransferase [Myxococcota bacterium]|nr:glycosyltransferase [Myxococcota bacterium]
MPEPGTALPSPAAPRATVLVAVWNGAAALPRTLDSVGRQTLGDLECLVVDDGSTDETPSVLAAIARRDPRFRVIRNPRNVGLTRSLARGLDEARAPVVARLDCGDAAHPGRLERQVALLAHRPDVVLVSSRVRIVDGAGEPVCAGLAEPGDVRAARLLAGNPFVHSAVAFRTDAVRALSGYDPRFRYAQDYELWTRLLLRGPGHVLDEALVDWTLDPGGLTVKKRALQKRYREIARDALRARLGGMPEDRVEAQVADALASVSAPPSPPPPARPAPYDFLCAKAALANGDLPACRARALRSLTHHRHAPSAALWALTFAPTRLREGITSLATRARG